MAETTTGTPERHTSRPVVYNNGVASGAYGMGFIGALIYFLQHADSFWVGVWGIIQAIFWPAVLVYRLLEYLK